jgi:hypothetical protein
VLFLIPTDAGYYAVLRYRLGWLSIVGRQLQRHHAEPLMPADGVLVGRGYWFPEGCGGGERGDT